MVAGVSAVLVVENGVHQAARAGLAKGRNPVGCSVENSIIISDLRNPGTSFTLEHLGPDIVLHADAPIVFRGGKTVFRGSKTLGPGQSRRCVNGMRFTSGGVALRLEIVGLSNGSARGSIRSGFKTLLLVPVTFALVAMMSEAAVSFKAVTTVMPSDHRAETTGSTPSSLHDGMPSSLQRQAAALESLQQHLAEVGLSSLALTARPDGSIEALGQISKDQEATWHEVEHWFDATADGQVVLVNAVSVGVAAAPPLAIQAVWPGHDPYVIDGDGSKHFIGSTLPSGWTVADISKTHVLVKRGQQSLAVRF